MASPFQANVVWVGVSWKYWCLTASGGKYWFPSTSIVASLSANVTSFQTAFMFPRNLRVQYFIPNGPGPDRPLRPRVASPIRCIAIDIRRVLGRPSGPGATRPPDRPHRLHGGPRIGGQGRDRRAGLSGGAGAGRGSGRAPGGGRLRAAHD